MGLQRIKLCLCILIVSILTTGAKSVPKLNIPPCPEGSTRIYHPDIQKPQWTGCKDSQGLYQGLIIQFSNMLEVLRIASIKNSLRNGKEIRFGATNTMEERNFKEGHLQGRSYVFKTEAVLGRIMPKPMTQDEWKLFQDDSKNSDASLLKPWLKLDPFSTITFNNGRMERIEFEKKDYHFKIGPDGRIFANDHPDMKGLFFIDPEPLWVLNADDMKKALVPGFGSCKKYSGPSGRFGRHFDHLLFQREKGEHAHLQKLQEILDRFIRFCIPQDIQEHLGVLECPPQLPSVEPASLCRLSYSDQLHLPYQPKFFKNEFTKGMPPEDFVTALLRLGLTKLVSNYEKRSEFFPLNSETKVEVKKGPHGLKFKTSDAKEAPKADDVATDGKDWAEWHLLPGY